jgi:rhodanese-related sulfurtransferase
MPMKNVDASTLKTWLEKGEAVLVDVREPSETATGIIPGAVLVPLGTVSGKTVPNVAGKKLVMQCRSGKRSQTAAEKLLAENPGLEVYNLVGGIMEWVGSGNSVR